MAGETTAHLILFITAIILASSVSTVAFVTVQKMAIGFEHRGNDLINYLSTDFEIINDPTLIPYDNGYVFYIKNTGEREFPFTNDTVTVLIDGVVVNDIYTTPFSLKPGDVGILKVNTTLSSGDHRLTVVLYNGVSKSFDFEV